MATPFVSTVFVVLTTLNNAGQLAPVDKSELPSPYTGAMFWSVEQCMYVRGRMPNPAKYVCQEFRGPKSTSWTPQPLTEKAVEPAPPVEIAPGDSGREGSIAPPRNDDVQLAGGRYHYSRPLFLWIDGEVPRETVTGLGPEVKPQTKPKRIAIRRHQQRYYALGPFDMIASLFVGGW
jgi:hypothetical protein